MKFALRLLAASSFAMPQWSSIAISRSRRWTRSRCSPRRCEHAWTPMNTQVVVIGGGISGLACAYRLFHLGVPLTLLEAEDRSGGLIGTVEQDGFLFETGPQSFQGIDSVLDVVRDIGLENHLEQANPRAPRYVVRRGRLETIPMSPQA